LNNAGNFQATSTYAISVADNTITGSGYAGLTLQSRIDNAYSDEWYFYSLGNAPTSPAPLQRYNIVRGDRGRGRVNQPLAVRFGTPVIPLFLLSHGIVWRDPSRRWAAIDKGRVWYPVPARMAPPPIMPFAFWPTIRRRVDTPALWRRIAAGKARTPTAFA